MNMCVYVLNFYCLAAPLQLFPLVLDLLSGAGVSCARYALITAYNSHQISPTWPELDRPDRCLTASATGRRGPVKLSRSCCASIFSRDALRSSHIRFPNAGNCSAPSKICNFCVSACSQMYLKRKKIVSNLGDPQTDIYFCTSCWEPLK